MDQEGSEGLPLSEQRETLIKRIGGIFDASGTRFFVSVQHNVTGHGVVLEVTGWR